MSTPEHLVPHLVHGECHCDCPACVDEWQPMSHGGARRHCICPDCPGGDCPVWRTDAELHALVTRRPNPWSARCSCGNPARRAWAVNETLPDGTQRNWQRWYCDDCWPDFPHAAPRTEGHVHVDA